MWPADDPVVICRSVCSRLRRLSEPAARHTGVPPKTTPAYKALTKNLDRARALSRIFDAGNLKPKPGDKRAGGRPSDEERELLRATVIYSIGALDAYLSDVAAHVLVAQLEAAAGSPTSDSRALLKRVMKEIDTLPLELAMTSDPATRRKVATEAITEHLANRVSNHGSKGVAATLGRMGATIDWNAIQLPPNSDLCASANDGCAKALDDWTESRHQLVHQGKAVSVNSNQARGLIDFVQAIAAQVDAQALAALKP